MKNRVGSLFAEASFDKFMKYFYDALMWLSVLAMLSAYRMEYKPSDFTIYISISASIILSLFLIYLIEKEKSAYQAKVKNLKLAPKILIYSCFFGMFYCAFAYALCYSAHYMSAQNTPEAVYVVPVGDTGRKMTHCATTIRVIGVADFLKYSYQAEAINYCLSKEQYNDILRVYSGGSSDKAKTFIAEYRSSIFGKEFVEANRINDVIK